MSLTYSVEGTWPFPLDMLRHDGSLPASAEDKVSVERLSAEFAPDRSALRLPATITLVMQEPGRRVPCAPRWESFGWRVLAVDQGRRELPAPSGNRDALRQRALAKLTADEREALGL